MLIKVIQKPFSCFPVSRAKSLTINPSVFQVVSKLCKLIDVIFDTLNINVNYYLQCGYRQRF